MKLTITDQYQNMAEIIAGCMHLIENAKKACENAGVAPLVLPIRGGTDGCQLSFMGLPCPNLGTGDMHSMDHMNTSRQREWTRLWISQLSL